MIAHFLEDILLLDQIYFVTSNNHSLSKIINKESNNKDFNHCFLFEQTTEKNKHERLNRWNCSLRKTLFTVQKDGTAIQKSLSEEILV